MVKSIFLLKFQHLNLVWLITSCSSMTSHWLMFVRDYLRMRPPFYLCEFVLTFQPSLESLEENLFERMNKKTINNSLYFIDRENLNRKENTKICEIQKEWMKVCMYKSPILYVHVCLVSKRYENLWVTYIWEEFLQLLVEWKY